MKKKLLAIVFASVGMLLTAGCNNSKKPSTEQPSSEQPSTETGGTNTGEVETQATVKTCAELVELGKALKATSTDTYKVTGTVTAQIGKSFTIQDATGGLYIYFDGETVPTDYVVPEVGKKVEIVTKLGKNYSGLVQTEQNAAKVTVLGEGDSYTPEVVSAVSDITQDKQSKLAKADNLILKKAVTAAEGSSFNIETKLGNDDLTLRVDKRGANAEAIRTKVSAYKVGTKINVSKALYGWFNGAQLSLVSADDITSEYVEVTGLEVKDNGSDLTTISLDTSEGATNKTYDLSTKVTVLPANASNKNVEYSVNDEGKSVVSVTSAGLVEAKSAGSATVTIKSESLPTIKKDITVTVTGTAAPKVEKTIDYTFTMESNNGTLATSDKIKGAITTTGTTIIDKVEATNNYLGANGGSKDTAWTSKVGIKIGKSGKTDADAGLLKLTFIKDVTKIKLVYRAFKATNTIAVDNIAGVTTTSTNLINKDNCDSIATADNHDFELTSASNTLTIKTGPGTGSDSRVFLYSFTLTYLD